MKQTTTTTSSVEPELYLSTKVVKNAKGEWQYESTASITASGIPMDQLVTTAGNLQREAGLIIRNEIDVREAYESRSKSGIGPDGDDRATGPAGSGEDQTP